MKDEDPLDEFRCHVSGPMTIKCIDREGHEIKARVLSWKRTLPLNMSFAVDVTGGNTLMSIRLYETALVLNAKVFYIDSDRHGRFIIPGTERLIPFEKAEDMQKHSLDEVLDS
jgi:hypothetical protein